MFNFKYDISIVNLESIDKFNPVPDLLDLLKEHDINSYLYSINTAAFNLAISLEYGIKDSSVLKNIILSGLLHDIGKLGMSSGFINYPGAYNLSMFNEMKKHPVEGANLLQKFNIHTDIIEAVHLHHFNFDSSGYPIVPNLSGKGIPLNARITRISDSADAYLTKRCYKEGGPSNLLLDDLTQYNGSSYDPDLLKAFEIVHKKIMNDAHKFGEDRPSRKMYMELLFQRYVTDNFKASFPSH